MTAAMESLQARQHSSDSALEEFISKFDEAEKRLGAIESQEIEEQLNEAS